MLWSERSPVVAAMLNPALLASVIAAACEEHERAAGDPMPWPLAFVVAPLVLHRATRAALPRTTRSHLARWVNDNPVLRAGIPQRAIALAEPVREGLRFGLSHEALTVTDSGLLRGSLAETATRIKGGDAAAIVERAGFVGKWFTKVDRPSTIFALLGVAP